MGRRKNASGAWLVFALLHLTNSFLETTSTSAWQMRLWYAKSQLKQSYMLESFESSLENWSTVADLALLVVDVTQSEQTHEHEKHHVTDRDDTVLCDLVVLEPEHFLHEFLDRDVAHGLRASCNC